MQSPNCSLHSPVATSTPNSIFISMRLQSTDAHDFSRISKMVTVILAMIPASTAPIKTPPHLNWVARICSIDHCGSFASSSWSTGGETIDKQGLYTLQGSYGKHEIKFQDVQNYLSRISPAQSHEHRDQYMLSSIYFRV